MMKKWEQQQQGSKSDTSNTSNSNGLALDVTEDELKYTLFADVPGLLKPDLSIRLSKENVLTISGERKVVSEEGVVSQQERPVGPFKRQWTLPEDADGAAISAKVTNGVLSITVGKKVKEPEPEPEPDTEIPWLE
jgi:HSP20 family protein